jgi:hypothetical protein
VRVTFVALLSACWFSCTRVLKAEYFGTLHNDGLRQYLLQNPRELIPFDEHLFFTADVVKLRIFKKILHFIHVFELSGTLVR